jgi:hypothetical protein
LAGIDSIEGTMAKTDWGTLGGGLSDSDVLRGPTAGVASPNGGGSHVFGMRCVSATPGAVGKHCLQTNFSPTTSLKGGRISGAQRRASYGAANGFAPFFFFCAQGSAVSAEAYLLGLTDEVASHIELRKGLIADGMPAPALVQPAIAPHVLMRSTDTFAADTWQHLRLDVLVQGTGDVVLQVFRSDLASHPVTSPVWQTVPGMEGGFTTFQGFVDDALGVNTGSAPLTSGYMGFGARFEAANRAVYFDHLAIDRQL